MGKVTLEIEETVSFTDYKSVRHKIIVEEEYDGDLASDFIDTLSITAQLGMRKVIKRFLRGVDKERLCGGLSHQYVYLNGRRKKDAGRKAKKVRRS